MTIGRWLAESQTDAERRHLHELVPLLETLGKATASLRAARWLPTADGPTPTGSSITPSPDGE